MAEKPGGRPSSAVPVTDIVEIRHRELNRLPRVHADPRSRWLSVLASLADPDLAAVDDLTVRQALRALADATVRARASDLECFARFCAGSGARGLPATRATIVAYADTLATAGQKVTSIQRKLSSIGVAHGMMGLENPCRSAAVHHAVRAIRKERGVARRQAFAVRLGDDTKALPSAITLRALLAACGDDPPEVRDAALLSIAYDGGLRASEVLAVRVEDIGALEDGSGTLWLSRSKTDQAGEGAFVYLSPETMQRVARWCDIATITGGTVFRQIQRRTRELSRGRPERPDVKVARWRQVHRGGSTGRANAAARVVSDPARRHAGIVAAFTARSCQDLPACRSPGCRSRLHRPLRSGTRNGDCRLFDARLSRRADPGSLCRTVRRGADPVGDALEVTDDRAWLCPQAPRRR